MALTFGQVDDILASMGRVHPARRSAFESRLKQWRKMNFPDLPRVGKGMLATYGAQQLFQLIVLVELLRFGLTPERAIRVIVARWPEMRQAITETVICLARSEDHRHYLQIGFDALADLVEPERDVTPVDVALVTDRQIAAAYGGLGALPAEGAFEPRHDGRANMRLEGEPADITWRALQAEVRNSLAHTLLIEIDSLVMRAFWTMEETAGVSPSIFVDEFAEWMAELDSPDPVVHQDRVTTSFSVPEWGQEMQASARLAQAALGPLQV